MENFLTIIYITMRQLYFLLFIDDENSRGLHCSGKVIFSNLLLLNLYHSEKIVSFISVKKFTKIQRKI